MDIRELNLSSREERTLESMGFTSVERIALCYRDDLGLGKTRGDAIIQRAKNILANRSVREVSVTEDRVAISLNDTSRPILVSVQNIPGLSDELKKEVDGDRLIIFKPKRKSCSKCGNDGGFHCKECGTGLCDACRYTHQHPYGVLAISREHAGFEHLPEHRSGACVRSKQQWHQRGMLVG